MLFLGDLEKAEELADANERKFKDLQSQLEDIWISYYFLCIMCLEC